ncbi:MAG: ABC transporter permease [Planctomycetota bacterium]
MTAQAPAATAGPGKLPLPGFIDVLVENRALIWQLAQRQLLQKTRGSTLGLLWWLLSPLLLLGAYTFAFAYVIGVRWKVEAAGGDIAEGGVTLFTLNLFAGLIIQQFNAEVLTNSPVLITGNEQYVKRIVFPVEVLPGVTLTVATIGWVFSFVALILMTLILQGPPAWTVIFAPLIILPAVLTSLGISWAIAAIGVFVRDTRNIVQVAVLAMLFLSPVFYPIERLESFLPGVQFFHPYATVMEQLRASIFDPSSLGSTAWFSVLGISLVVAWAGHRVFRTLRPLFADVL